MQGLLLAIWLKSVKWRRGKKWLSHALNEVELAALRLYDMEGEVFRTGVC